MISIRYFVKNQSGKGQRLVNLTPVKAVKQMCLECSNHRYRDVQACSNLNCKLHSWREGRHNHPHFIEPVKLSIIEYCRDCSNNFTVDDCELCYLRPFRRYMIDNKKEERSKASGKD